MLSPLTLPVVRVDIELQAEATIELPAYSGSTFRGALGHTLKASTCALNGTCDNCLLPDTCVFHYLFETEHPDNLKVPVGSTEVPRPFVLSPMNIGRVVPVGHKVLVSLRLMGRGIDYLAHFLWAMEQTGRRGLGRKNARFRVLQAEQVASSGKRHRFYHTTSEGEGIFESEIEPEPLSSWALEPLGTRLSLLFLNPTRLKFRGELTSNPPFHVLLRNLIRRIALLSEVHGEGPLQLESQSLIELAQEITTEASNLHWLDWKRHSNRQKRKVKSGGFVGRVTYQGDFTPFLPLLGAGRLTHVGKSTTFGLGAYRCTD